MTKNQMSRPPCRIKWWADSKGSPHGGPLASRGPNSCRELGRIVQESTLAQSPKRRRMRRGPCLAHAKTDDGRNTAPPQAEVPLRL